jgi:L-fucose isomerase
MIHLINSGACTLVLLAARDRWPPAIKPWWQVTPEECPEMPGRHHLVSRQHWLLRGGGYSSGFLGRGGMPMTMCRLNLVKGLGPVLQIAEGWTVDLPTSVHEQLNERTDPTWPTHWFVPNLTGKSAFRDVYSVMANWGANHGALSYGHIGADLISLASILRIPVCMHNVPEEQVFRPSAWTAFGVGDMEAADFRACANFGPIYG